MAPIPGGYYAGGHVAPSFTAKTEAACKTECLVSPDYSELRSNDLVLEAVRD